MFVFVLVLIMFRNFSHCLLIVQIIDGGIGYSWTLRGVGVVELNNCTEKSSQSNDTQILRGGGVEKMDHGVELRQTHV